MSVKCPQHDSSDIPQSLFFTYGATMIVSGLDHDSFKHDDFAGNGYVRLTSIAPGTTDCCIETDESIAPIVVPLTKYDVTDMSKTMIFQVH